MKIPKKVSERIVRAGVRFQGVLQSAKDRDVNESDTVTIITDMLSEVFGYDKYTEITSEQAIRGTFCDLAIRIEGKVRYLIEVKAIGLNLRENHLRQAINYGAHMGIPWIVLTNGARWEIYRLTFDRPISHEHVCSIDFLGISPRKAEDQQALFLLCREGVTTAAIEEFHEHVQVVNRFMLGAIIQSEPVLDVMRRELKRLAPNLRVEKEEIAGLLDDVLKRDVVEGESADSARRRVNKASGKVLRKKKQAKASPGVQTEVPPGQMLTTDSSELEDGEA